MDDVVDVVDSKDRNGAGKALTYLFDFVFQFGLAITLDPQTP